MDLFFATLSTHANKSSASVVLLRCSTVMRSPSVFFENSFGVTHVPSSADIVSLIVQRFNFQYAASTPAVRHASVIPVGPADGMMMKVT